MSQGGARVKSGPPPDPNALRRESRSGLDRDGWTTLPARHDGPVPTWPLLTWAEQVKADSDDRAAMAADARDQREQAVWREIWTTPAAAAWARFGWVHDAAMYVRFLVQAEAGDKPAATEARQWSDRLGLNPAAMLRNRWRVAPDQVTAARASRETPVVETPTARNRLKAAAGGGA